MITPQAGNDMPPPIDGAGLRYWEAADAPKLVRAWADPEIKAWNPVPSEPTLATAQRWIAGVQGRLLDARSVDIVIVSPPLGGVVGEVGLSGFDPAHRGALIGYWLLPEARGRGLASAALASITGWAHDRYDLDVIVARCHPANAASHRVAARAGYALKGTDPSGHQLWRSRTRGP